VGREELGDGSVAGDECCRVLPRPPKIEACVRVGNEDTVDDAHALLTKTSILRVNLEECAIDGVTSSVLGIDDDDRPRPLPALDDHIRSDQGAPVTDVGRRSHFDVSPAVSTALSERWLIRSKDPARKLNGCAGG
jgi:hypothetical protein